MTLTTDKFLLFCMFLAFIVGMGNPLQGQDIVGDSTRASILQVKGDAFLVAIKYDQAIACFSQAADLYKRHSIWDEYVTCLISVGAAYRKKGAWGEAEEAFQISIAAAQQNLEGNSFQLAKAYGGLGGLYLSRGDYRKASNFYNQSRKIKEAQQVPDSSSLAGSFTNLGLCSFRLARYDEAISYYEQAVALRKALNQEKSSITAYVYRGLGLIYQDKGEYSLAKEYLERCLEIQGQKAGLASSQEAAAYLDLGNLSFLQYKLDEALQYFQYAMDTYLRMGKDQPAAIAWAHLNLGVVYHEKENFDEAEASLFTALEIFKRKYSPVYSGTALTYLNLGDVYKDQKAYEQARDYFELAREIYEDIHGPNYSLVIQTYHRIGEVYRLEGEHDQALKVFSYAQSILEHNLRNTRHLPLLMLDVLRDQGRAFVGMYEENEQVESLQMALDRFQQVHAWMDSLRGGYSYDESKMFLQQNYRMVFEEAIAVCVQLHELTGDVSYLEEAFAMSERSKAALLLETVRASGARNRSGVPDHVFQEEKTLKARVVFYEQQIYEEQGMGAQADTLKMAEWQEELFGLRRQHEDMLDRLQEAYPHYYQPEYNNKVADVKALQAYLAQGQEHLIEYFIGDSNLFVFLVSPQDIKVIQSKPEEHLQRDIRLFLRDVSDPYLAGEGRREDLRKLATQAHTWYLRLLEKPLAQLGVQDTQLIIVPDGILGYLPFEMLLRESVPDPRSFHGLPYVLNDFMIRYAYSATLLVEPWEASNKKYRYAFAGFAPDYSMDIGQSMTLQIAAQSPDNFPQLAYNQPEVSSIANLTGGKAMLGKKATESSFKRLSPGTRILHLATHAFLDDRDPLYSGMVFSRGELPLMMGDGGGVLSDSLQNYAQEDGFLYAFELYNMRLDAELAVLSACNTGIGQINRGEGVMSLSRAFRQAGCPNLVMSLWQADDRAAFDLMEAFYRNLNAGMGKGNALRQAKLEYLEKHDSSHPQYWASFVLIGDNQAVNMRTRFPFWILMGISVLTMVLLAYYRQRHIRGTS